MGGSQTECAKNKEGWDKVLAEGETLAETERKWRWGRRGSEAWRPANENEESRGEGPCSGTARSPVSLITGCVEGNKIEED